MARSQKLTMAFVGFVFLAIVGLTLLAVGLNLHSHDLPLPSSFCSSNSQPALTHSIRALCAHLNDMWHLGLALSLLGIVVCVSLPFVFMRCSPSKYEQRSLG
jgi:putative Mn2+ efflux pump MntP